MQKRTLDSIEAFVGNDSQLAHSTQRKQADTTHTLVATQSHPLRLAQVKLRLTLTFGVRRSALASLSIHISYYRHRRTSAIEFASTLAISQQSVNEHR